MWLRIYCLFVLCYLSVYASEPKAPLDEDDCCDDEEFKTCGTFCPETCANRGKSVKCTNQCVRGCFCKNGLVRNIDGLCVDPKDCGERGCGGDPNAHPGCGINCGKTCATYKDPPKVCPLGCILHGCDCNDGYVKDTNVGKCVEPKDCTPVCSINETYSKNPTTCPQLTTCSSLGKGLECPHNISTYPPACICKEGYLRNKENKCILKADCDTCGGDPHARLGCGNSCGRTCADIDAPPTACPASCRSDGCDCIQGYWLDTDKNLCVLPKDCPKKGCGGDPNAHRGCGTNCNKTCAAYKNPVKICPRHCSLRGCECNDGYVLDPSADKCVRPKDCLPLCGVNEVYRYHPVTCPPQTCDAVGKQFKCPANSTGPPGCVCRDGYLRNTKNACVLRYACDTCGDDPHAHPGCGHSCGRTCADICRPPYVCPFVLPVCSFNVCDCVGGYLFDTDTNKCVLLKDCHKKCKGCKGDLNSEFVKCPDPCPPTCANGGVKPKLCSRACLLDGCQCLPGFVLDDKGKCILLKNCPPKEPTCGINEVWGCLCLPRPTCDNQCEEDGSHVCPLDSDGNCVKECICKPGFVRGSNGVCTHCTQCTPLDKDDCCDDEEFQSCGTFCPETCASRGKSVKCTEQCVQGCFCKKGQVRNVDGLCVDPKECAPVCSINETFSQKPETCPPQTCDAIGKAFACPANVTGPPSCICKVGYLRNKENKCVLKDDCDTCGGDSHARPGCGNSCGRECADIDAPPHACPAFCRLNGCDCMNGYWLDTDTNKCVLPRDCPEKGKGCKGDPNAEFVKCPDPCPATCANGGVKPKLCRRLCLLEGCQCLPGFVLDDVGKCILLEQCPPKGCNGDPNAHPGCGMNCGKTCATYKHPPKVCPIGCILHGCDCNDGYVKDPNVEKCVKPEDCTPVCSINETFSQKPETCPPQTCDAIGKAFACLANVTGPPSCICKVGYLRNKEKKCVLKDDCDTCGGDSHARPGCGNSCGRTCADIDAPTHACPLSVFCRLDGCDCIEGYWLDTDENKCVLPKDCPEKCKGCKGDPNAELVKCPDPCPATCANGGVKLPCRRLCLLEGCQCRPGFVLDDEGKCILLKQCPPKGCNGDPNAHPGCGLNCGKTCATYKNPPKVCPLGCILHGCDCNDGYVKDTNVGKCVEPKHCTPICSINETFSQNPETCPPQTCDAIGKAFACPANVTGPPACICKVGYLRNKENKCVLKADCDTCGDDSHARPGCGNSCGRTCADIDAPSHACPDFCRSDGCDCIKGYWLDTDTNTCVLPRDCPSKCKGCKGDPNAELVPCPNPCPATCGNGGVKPKVCTRLCVLEGCQCRPGFVKDDEGKCILLKQCPPKAVN